MDIKEYNKKIGKILLDNQYKEIEKKNYYLIKGGGNYKYNSRPLPITSTYEPSFETPTSNINIDGGKMPKFIRNLGHEVRTIGAPILRKGATKLLNIAVDKGINYLTNPTPSMGSGIKKRGRPRKIKDEMKEEHYSDDDEHGGKFNFIKTMTKISKNPIVKK
jgi:hypothetical protein